MKFDETRCSRVYFWSDVVGSSSEKLSSRSLIGIDEGAIMKVGAGSLVELSVVELNVLARVVPMLLVELDSDSEASAILALLESHCVKKVEEDIGS